MHLETDFTTPLAFPWRLTEIGAGRVIQSSGALRLELPVSSGKAYHDAQISDYAGKSDFRWKPPLRMEVRAGVSRQSPSVTPSQPFPASREGLPDGSSPPPCTRGGGWGVGLNISPQPEANSQSLAANGGLSPTEENPHPPAPSPLHGEGESGAVKPLSTQWGGVWGGDGGQSYNSFPLRGTAGFGFWNHPFVPGERGFRLPQAVWFFFSSPPSDMRLALDVPGAGWKAATIDAARWRFLMLLPTAPLGFLLMRFPALYRRLWPIAQKALGVSEALLDMNLLLESHIYSLDWRADGVTFAVNGAAVHHAPVRLGGPLGFIAWVDNQYAVVTPQGRFGFGLVDVPETQALVVEYVRIVEGE